MREKQKILKKPQTLSILFMYSEQKKEIHPSGYKAQHFLSVLNIKDCC